MDGTPKPSEEWIEKQRSRWLEITGRQPEPKIDVATLRIAIDPLLPYKAGQIRYRSDGIAAIYMSAETAANQVLSDAVVAHEVAHFRFSRNKTYRFFKGAIRLDVNPGAWTYCSSILVLSVIFLGIVPTITPQFPENFANSQENFRWFLSINALAAIGFSVLSLWLIRLPLAMLNSLRCQIEELLADREAVRAGHREGVLMYIDSCPSRWWHFLKTHPPRGLRRFFAERIWKPDPNASGRP